MSAPKTPDTTAIRAFAAGMRTSVGIRDELLAAKGHLLDLCDALDAERDATAHKPPPRRASEEKAGPKPLSLDELVAKQAAYLAKVDACAPVGHELAASVAP